MLAIAIDRDSVHAGDDLSSHASSIQLDPTATLRTLFEAIRTMYHLPCINGMKLFGLAALQANK
ncbi:hypothetical protein [Pseudomonas capsici]|uniref:hypothetical protein n=1 Tax=Pseudomonas capsici TaxID=2810614 RepID=UPI001E4B3698|nr:hypothetical protein [Pseudomonas capsici]